MALEMVSRGFNPEGLIAESQSKISVFDAQIAELQSLRSVERNKIGKLRYLSSPLSVLPLEMLSEIFKHSVASGLHLRQPPAVHLSEVCQYWRQVTNSLPWLWSELRIEVDENPQKAYLEAVRAWLARSAQLPLSIALTLDLEDTQTHSVVIDEIVAVKSRLATLHILNCVYAPVLGSLIEGPLPALRTLRFEDSVEVPSAVVDMAEAQMDLTGAPHLRTVVFPEDFLGLFTNVPWPQLTYLRFFAMLEVGLYDKLRQVQNVEQLELQTYPWDVDDVSSFAMDQLPLVLPRLRDFTLTMDGSTSDVGYISPFFHCLAFPALESLKMSFDPEMICFWDPHPFSLFQARSPHVHHLSLVSAQFDSMELTSIVRLFPALTSLKLKNCYKGVDDAFLTTLEYRESDEEPLAARLEVILWHGWMQPKFTGVAFERMLRSRSLGLPPSPKIARLKKIRCDYGGSVTLSHAFLHALNASVHEFDVRVQ